jgi:hypothetical protein
VETKANNNLLFFTENYASAKAEACEGKQEFIGPFACMRSNNQ